MHETLNRLHDPQLSRALLEQVAEKARRFREANGRPAAFMEVCGSHTMALARTGLKARLKDELRLISGPGCPVCVTDQQAIDAMIALASDASNPIVCTFGDMMRVPGSRMTLLQAKTEGKDVRVVYSPTDAVRVAEENPQREVVFLGIGFETTIPVLAVAVKEAEDKNLSNFSLWLCAKRIEPIIRHLLNSGGVQLDGFLLPGHVSIVLGSGCYRYIAEEYALPGVIAGFEPLEMAGGLYRLLELAETRTPAIVNAHRSMVSECGNLAAQRIIDAYFVPCDEAWRGIGAIADSGYAIREAYGRFDAKRRFSVKVPPAQATKCRCGEVITGAIAPPACALFGKACTPAQPVGPCMVSAEGTCAAYYHYMKED